MTRDQLRAIKALALQCRTQSEFDDAVVAEFGKQVLIEYLQHLHELHEFGRQLAAVRDRDLAERIDRLN